MTQDVYVLVMVALIVVVAVSYDCFRSILLRNDISVPGEGVLPEKLSWGVRPTPHNPYPIYDQNLRYFITYL